MAKFKDIPCGIFRATNGLCYTKLEKEISYDEDKKANAVMISQGYFKYFNDSDEVEIFRES